MQSSQKPITISEHLGLPPGSFQKMLKEEDENILKEREEAHQRMLDHSKSMKEDSFVQLLSGHISPETAYVVDDYPYGFRLRCKKRYWLEYSKNRGVRFCNQTTNPKKQGEVWNKPKYSTYMRYGGAMYLDEKGHVSWCGIGEYSDLRTCIDWQRNYGEANHPDCKSELEKFIKQKIVLDKAKARGEITLTIGKETHVLESELNHEIS